MSATQYERDERLYITIAALTNFRAFQTVLDAGFGYDRNAVDS